MRIAIIGGGFMGLAAAWEAVNSGAETVVFEREANLGGLARVFNVGGETFECYHHFISGNDDHLLEMARLLGVIDEIAWNETKLGYFVRDRVVPFTTASDLLNFPVLSVIDKMRFGISMMLLTRRSSWNSLESISARKWLISTQGQRTYDTLWAHLMEMKFADEARVIPLSWLWSRSKRRASNRKLLGDVERFGVFTKSDRSMTEAFARNIAAKGGVCRASARVTLIEKNPAGKLKVVTDAGAEIFDRVIVTVPLPAFAEMVPALPSEYVKSFESIKYAGIINMVVALAKPLTPYFWLNISDRDIPFPGVIEMTYLRKPPQGMSVIYLPNYVPSDSPEFSLTDEQLFARYHPALKRINPAVEVKEYYVFRDTHADPYYCLNYSKILPAPRTPIDGIFLANTSQVYPVTRSLNNSIWWGREVARMVLAG